LEHDPEKHALGHGPMGGKRFSLGINAKRLPEIMLKQTNEIEARRLGKTGGSSLG